MRPHLPRILCASAFLLVAFAPDPAYAQRRGIPVPIVFGWGETIGRVGELPERVREEVRRELGHDVSIGFHYHRVHVFWLDLWTWDGRHVLYRGDRYWALGPDDWGQLIGYGAARELDQPLSYRFPMGAVLIGTLFLVGTLWSRVFPSGRERARRLLRDERYREAIELYVRRVEPPADGGAPGGGTPAPEEAAFEDAVRLLGDRGVDAGQAEKNLRTILRALAEGDPS
jgi:hypothetical protein